MDLSLTKARPRNFSRTYEALTTMKLGLLERWSLYFVFQPQKGMSSFLIFEQISPTKSLPLKTRAKLPKRVILEMMMMRSLTMINVATRRSTAQPEQRESE